MSPTPAAASAPPWPPPGPPATTSCGPTWPGCIVEALRAGHHHDGDQEWVRSERRGRGPVTADRRASSPTETTYLGAHVVPAEYAEAGPTTTWSWCAGRCSPPRAPYARWVDVFCERGAFDADQARAVLEAGIAAGLMPRVHANQLGPGPRRPARRGARRGQRRPLHPPVTDRDVDALGRRRPPWPRCCRGPSSPPARPTRTPGGCSTAGVTVALATDCNPGSSYTSSMPFCLALAVREMRMTPAEALWSATAGGARALRRTDVGQLRRRRPGRPVDPRRAVLPAPGLPARRSTGPHRPAQWGARI